MRRHGGGSRPLDAMPDTCTERHDIDPTGNSMKVVGASYPARSGGVPLGYRHRGGVGMHRQKSAEAIAGVNANRRVEHVRPRVGGGTLQEADEGGSGSG